MLQVVRTPVFPSDTGSCTGGCASLEARSKVDIRRGNGRGRRLLTATAAADEDGFDDECPTPLPIRVASRWSVAARMLLTAVASATASATSVSPMACEKKGSALVYGHAGRREGWMAGWICESEDCRMLFH